MTSDRPYDTRNPYDRDRDGCGRASGSGRQSYSSNYRDDRDDRNFRGGGTGWDHRDQGRPDSYGGRETYGAGNRDYYGASSGHADRSNGQQHYGGFDRQDGYRRPETTRDQGRYGRPPQGYDHDDRGFIARAGDEVRSWFGDEEAERRRDYDQRYDERQAGQGAAGTAYGRDTDYHSWRRNQIDALDRDYHEYRQENAKTFESEFGTWRSNRQTQRASLGQIREHMDVVGSDGGHVGTVDKVRGDRIILTKTDSDAGGRHHSIPSTWLQTIDDKVTISKTADEAKKHWRDEEASGALFGDQDRIRGADKDGRVDLGRSFSGTY